MEQAVVNFRIDKKLKKQMEILCDKLGMSMTAAFTIFAKKMTNEQRIPFDVSIDPYYTGQNKKYIQEGIDALRKGRGKKHDLIEV